MSEPTEPLTKKELDELDDSKPIYELDDHQALIRVQSDYEQAQSNKADAIERCNRYLNIYKAKDPPGEVIDETSGRIDDDESIYSNGYWPVGAAIADSAITKLFNQFFSTDQYMKIDADDFEDEFFAIEVTAHLFKRLKEMKFKNTVYKAIQHMVCFDYAITGTRWLVEAGFVPKIVRKQEEIAFGKLKMSKQTVKAEARFVPDKVDRSDVFGISYFDCYHDWTSRNGLKDSRFFIDDRWVMLEDLMSKSNEHGPWGKYKNIKDVMGSVLIGERDDLDKLGSDDERKEFVNHRRVKVSRYHTPNHIIEFAEGKIIRRMNVYDWFIQQWKLGAEPTDFRGIGIMERMERNQLDINASMNSRRDLQNLISNPFVLMDQSVTNTMGGDLDLYPGRVLTSTGGNPKDKIYVYNPGQSNNQEAMADVQLQVEMMERQSNQSVNDQGAVAGGRTTATEINKVTASSAGRKETIAELIEEECLEPIYLNLFYLEQAFLSRKESFKYNGEFGDQFFAIDSSSYMWNSIPRFQALGTLSVTDELMKTQQFFEAMKVATQFPELHNMENILVEMWRKLHPKDYTKFVKDPTIPQENLPPDLENMLMAEGRRINVSPANDHASHMQVHDAITRSPDFQAWPEILKVNMLNHIKDHREAAVSSAVGGAPGQNLTQGVAS